MSNKPLCPEYTCPKRVTCKKYTDYPMGRNQSYMTGKSMIGDDCYHYIQTEEMDRYDVAVIDVRNKRILKSLS